MPRLEHGSFREKVCEIHSALTFGFGFRFLDIRRDYHGMSTSGFRSMIVIDFADFFDFLHFLLPSTRKHLGMRYGAVGVFVYVIRVVLLSPCFAGSLVLLVFAEGGSSPNQSMPGAKARCHQCS